MHSPGQLTTPARAGLADRERVRPYTFRVGGILIVVRATRVALTDVGVAHRMIDQENLDLTSQLAFGTAGVEGLERAN
jgi:hypothetical protein